MQTKRTPEAASPAVFRPGLSLGRVAGVNVRIHWTWLAAAVLVTVSLASGVFPAEVGGLSEAAYVAMGAATTLLFFASLLLHELGHALEARREGIPTRGITLWMLGGVAESGAPFPTPGAEARIALAGPAVSAVLGAVFVVAGHSAGLPAAVAAVLEWLGWTNVLLLAFNLLPALPLDGGRVLRAMLWRNRGSHLEATRAAVTVSQVLAVALIAVGVLGGVVGGALSGLWLAFVGFFVFSAGTAERAGAEAQAALAGIDVAQVMTPDPVTITANASAQDLIELARRTGHTTYPVIEVHGETLGLVSVLEADRLPERGRPWISVRELLAEIPQPPALDAEGDALSAVPTLTASPLHRAAVRRAGRLVGFLSLTDVVRAIRTRAAA